MDHLASMQTLPTDRIVIAIVKQSYLVTFLHFTSLSVARFHLLVVSNAIQAIVRRRGVSTGSCTLFDASSTSHTALAPFSNVAPSSIYYNKHKTLNQGLVCQETLTGECYF